MTQFNPLAPAILVSQTQAQRKDADKVSQLRRAQVLARNVAATSDRYEHVVESTEQLAPSHEDGGKKQPRPKKAPPAKAKPKPTDDQPEGHLDLTA